MKMTALDNSLIQLVMAEWISIRVDNRQFAWISQGNSFRVAVALVRMRGCFIWIKNRFYLLGVDTQFVARVKF